MLILVGGVLFATALFIAGGNAPEPDRSFCFALAATLYIACSVLGVIMYG